MFNAKTTCREEKREQSNALRKTKARAPHKVRYFKCLIFKQFNHYCNIIKLNCILFPFERKFIEKQYSNCRQKNHPKTNLFMTSSVLEKFRVVINCQSRHQLSDILDVIDHRKIFRFFKINQFNAKQVNF